MNILLVYPKYPETFWGFKHALKFIFKKATHPPLGLLTVAAMLPEKWEKKLIDMNVTSLKNKDIKWADYVFISAMDIQKESVKEIIIKCKKSGTQIVAGGPLFTVGYKEFKDIDHFVLNEAEITLPEFLKDLKNESAKHVYSSNQMADINLTPIPLWNLINVKKYAVLNVQYSRGCPFNCDFCDITLLYGSIPRTKNQSQIITELDSLYSSGWKGEIFFVDDNFIGNKRKLKDEILPAIADWMDINKHPFIFNTQASIDLSDDDELLQLMVKAGFNQVFIGIETPNEESLNECTKFQNKNRDLSSCIKKIQKFGLQIQGGFIVGFDNDPLSIFKWRIEFIQKSGIVIAMVSLLNALRGTKFYHRLKKENRILKNMSGNNTDCSINFIPKMDYDTLIKGYKKILSTIYSPSYYYKRVEIFLKEYNPLQKRIFVFRFSNFITFFKSVWNLGIIGKERVYFWKLILWSLFKHPRLFPLVTTFAIYGFHFRKTFKKYF